MPTETDRPYCADPFCSGLPAPGSKYCTLHLILDGAPPGPTIVDALFALADAIRFMAESMGGLELVDEEPT